MRRILWLCIALVCLVVACSDDDSDANKGVVAYILQADWLQAESFRILFEDNNYTFRAYTLAAAEVVSFSGCKAILIGLDAYTNNVYWAGSDLALSRIASSGALVIGLGRGGYCAFGSQRGLKLRVGYPYASWSTTDLAWPFNAGADIWKNPRSVDLSSDRADLYESAGSCANITSTINITRLARSTSSTNLASIIVQVTNGRPYLLWGYLQDASQLTEAGKNLLLNLVDKTSW